MLIEIIRFNQAGGVRTVSDTLRVGLLDRGYNTQFLEVVPPRDSSLRKAAKAILSRSGKLRSLAASALGSLSPQVLSLGDSGHAMKTRIYTHPNLIALVPPTNHDINIGWYHDSWDAARMNGHAHTALRHAQNFDHYVLLSQDDATAAAQELGIDCSYIPNPLTEPREAPSLPRQKRFVMLTRHETQKDIPLALSAWSKANLPPEWHLSIFGNGSKLKQNIKLALTLGLDNIDFIEWSDDPIGELSTSRALLSTSLHEGFPASFLEAFVSGTPIISVDSFPACKDLVTDEVGIRISSRSSEQISQALRRIAFLQEAEFSRLQAAARNRANDFALEKTVHVWSELFNTLINKANRAQEL